MERSGDGTAWEWNGLGMEQPGNEVNTKLHVTVLCMSADNTMLQLPLAPLLRKMEDIKERKVLKHCKLR